MVTITKQIADGVKISYIKTDKFKTNYISINFISPLSSDLVHYNSMLPLVLMRGTAKYPTQMDINKRLQFLYSGDIVARNSNFGEYHIFGFKANMLNDRFADDISITEETVDLLCDMAFNPYLVNGSFDESYTECEKISLIDTIEAEINEKGKYAIKRLMSEMCKNEVFGISKLGEIKDVKAITAKSLYKAYQKALKEYPIEIYFVGDGDFDVIADKFEKALKGIERAPIEIPSATLVSEVDKIRQIEDVENVKQGKLVLGFRTGYKPEENKYHLMQLFNEIYGGAPTAKLFLNVREKMSLCYYCRSIISQRTGIMLVSSGIEAKNKEIAEKAILEQLEMIKNGDITEEEMDSAKKSIRNGYMQIYDSAEAMESWVFFRSLCGISTTPMLECEKIEKTTKQEIQELTSKIKLDTVYFLRGKEKANG
ncbi:MAG: insulinase family protein [Ruminococcaceae bacterium]|nr:insulinase family protein [Oscillospiraceae bacterium]